MVNSGFEALLQLFRHWKDGLSAKKPLGSMTDPAQLSIVSLMSVAVYLRLHGTIPAEILPFGSRPPISAVITLLPGALSLYLYWKVSMRNHMRVDAN